MYIKEKYRSNSNLVIINKELLVKFLRKNVFVIIATVAAIITCFIIQPDKTYFDYIDYGTLALLFAMLAIVRGFEDIHFFQIVARRIVTHLKTSRTVILALVHITFIGSMLITNDMALLTFLPLGYYVLRSTMQEKYLAFTFNMQNIAANLGGMLTPFGNPQNLYLYSYFKIDASEFVGIMFLPFLVSITLITVCCLFVKNERLHLTDHFEKKLNPTKVFLYFILFGIFLAIIFKLIPVVSGFIIIMLVFLIFDRKILKKVDYLLLFTFFAFFIFAGNMARMDIVKEFFSELLLQNTLLTGVLASQVMSNVPSAILLSKFTTNYSDLLIAVNIGGAGTLIASLASLITYREYMKHYPNKQWYFLKLFSIYNFTFLIILTTFSLFVL